MDAVGKGNKKSLHPESASLLDLWDKSYQLLRCHPYCRCSGKKSTTHRTPTCAFHDNGGNPSAPTCQHGVQAALTSPFCIIRTAVIPPSTALCAYFTKHTCLDQRFSNVILKVPQKYRIVKWANGKYFFCQKTGKYYFV